MPDVVWVSCPIKVPMTIKEKRMQKMANTSSARRGCCFRGRKGGRFLASYFSGMTSQSGDFLMRATLDLSEARSTKSMVTSTNFQKMEKQKSEISVLSISVLSGFFHCSLSPRGSSLLISKTQFNEQIQHFSSSSSKLAIFCLL